MIKRSAFLPRLLAVLVLALGLALPVHAGTPAEDAEKYRLDMAEGVALLRAGHSDRSIAKFKSALKVDPESAEAYYWIALAYSDLTNYPRAAANARDATIYDDKLAEAWLLWGQVLLYQKSYSEARDKLEMASRLAPENPLVQYNLGRVYYHGFRDPGSALPRFRAVWQRSQSLRREGAESAAMVTNARLYMGLCEFDRQNWDIAITAFYDVLAEEPLNFDAALRMALAFRHSGRPRECEQILTNMARKISPDSLAERQKLAEVNLQLADLYLKVPVLKNQLFCLTYLKGFVALVGDGTHPALEAAREYIALYDFADSSPGEDGQR